MSLALVALALAASVLAILAVAMGYVLGWANRKFHVAVDPRVELLLAALPGANCGGCGYVGCSEYAAVPGAGGCPAAGLGLADSSRPCHYDAIQIVDGLSTIDYQKCVGCGACSRTCPRNIITLVPFKAERMMVVACSNQDTAADVRAVC